MRDVRGPWSLRLATVADGVVLRYADCPAGAGLYHLAITVHANRGFHLVWFNRSTEETHDRALFDEMLANVAFP